MKELYAEKKTTVVGVSNDSVAKNSEFASTCSFSYPLICDEDLSLSIKYGAATAGANSASRKAVLVAPDGTVAKYYDKVDARAFPEECVKAL